MVMLKPYQRIIGMGWDAVPLILKELQREQQARSVEWHKLGSRGVNNKESFPHGPVEQPLPSFESCQPPDRQPDNTAYSATEYLRRTLVPA
jgi:hypothetical protein